MNRAAATTVNRGILATNLPRNLDVVYEIIVQAKSQHDKIFAQTQGLNENFN